MSSDDQRYSLRWNDFYSNIISAFKTLKESEDFVDVTIACDGKSLKAHQVILSAASPFFRKLLKDHPHPHPIVILKDVRYEEMNKILDFIYHGEVQICQEDLTEFLRTAQTLQVKGLTDVPHISSRSPMMMMRSPSPSSTTPPPPLHHIPEVRMDNLSDDGTTSPPSDHHHQPAIKRLRKSPKSRDRERGRDRDRTGQRESAIIDDENVGVGGANGGVGAGPGVGVGIGVDGGESCQENHNHFNNNVLSRDETNLDSMTPDAPGAGGQNNIATTNDREKNEVSSDPELNSSNPINSKSTIKSSSSSSSANANHSNENNGKGATSQDNEKRTANSNHTSILIQALEQGRHQNYDRDRSGGDENSMNKNDSSNPNAMEEGSDMDDDEADMKYDDKGMDGIESCEELSAHALTEAMRFPAAAALLGFQGSLSGLPGFMPGPSNSSSLDVSRRSLDMLRVRATDPRPCPKCGKIYRSAHTLRTHLEDKHTICPGYRCVLCGTVAKSRNSLHSHMSRQHRGISTKDLPVLPMPAPFDPSLAARLLAKAGIKFPSPDIATGASPTSVRRSGLEVTPVISSENKPGSPKSGTGRSGSHPVTPKIDPGTTGSAILDTYLQFIAENSIALGGGLHYQRNVAHHHRNSSGDKNQVHSSGEVGDDDESGEEEDP